MSALTKDIGILIPHQEPLKALKVALLTGGIDRPYAFGLAMALATKNVEIDVIGSDEVDSSAFHTTPNVKFLNYRGNQREGASILTKVSSLAAYYARLIRYTACREPKIFHILWNNKLEYFDRTILMLYYKMLRKKICLTAHNVNQARRDANDSILNRLTLSVQYHLSDHIFVHTLKMKRELCEEFGVGEHAITVIRHPINNAFPDTELTPADAKKRLGLRDNDKVILFFGRIRPYKGIEHLVSAFRLLVVRHPDCRLMIVGEPLKGLEAYRDEIREMAQREFGQGKIILKIQFIPDDQIELYFKAADVLVLPYKEIFQSGVLFLSYSFGLPVVVTDVGSFRDDIVEGRTGFLCGPGDPEEMSETIEKYFASDLYKDLEVQRHEIKAYAADNHSWSAVAELTRKVYSELSGGFSL